MSYPLTNLGNVLGFTNFDGEVPVVFASPKSGRETVPIVIEVDTGATLTVAPVSLANALGLGLTDGTPIGLQGVGGSVRAYVHLLDLRIGDAAYGRIPVAIASDETVPFLLGRLGFWDQASIGIDNRARTITLTQIGGAPVAQLPGQQPPPNAGIALGILLIATIAIAAVSLK